MVSSIIACIIQCITSFWLVYPNNLFMRLLCFLYHLCSQVVLLGDLNYRISLEGAETRSLVKAKNWAILLENDQLLSEFSRGRHFEGWQEGLITFSPTYKYHPNSDQYYWCFDGARGQKKRAPAWCDRILWRGKGLKQVQYETCNYRLSDHRPVRAVFHAECDVSLSEGVQK